jgi:hypothetical protein
MAKKKAKFGAGTVQLPGFPSNVRHTQQAAQQLMAQHGVNSINEIPPINWSPQNQVSNRAPIANYNPVLQNLNAPQEYQGTPSSVEDLQRRMVALNLLSPNAQQPLSTVGAQQPQLQGPLQGLAGLNNFAPAQASPSIALPQPTAQNTAIPQGQVLHRTGQQRGGLGRFFLGNRPEVFNSPNFTPFQSEALNYLLQYGLGDLQDLGQNQFDFAPIGNQELERFYTQTIPSLAERFTAMGGGQRSSAFQGALANAGRYLGNDLAAQQQQYGLQQQGMQQNLISNLLNLGLTPQFAQNLNPGGGGLLGGLVNAGTQLGKAAVSGAMMA